MTGQSQQDEFDRQARAHYRNAASTLSPAMQGRLRAVRRTALATVSRQRDTRKHPSWWSAVPVAAMAAAVFAVAIGLRWERGGEAEVAPAGVSDVQSVADQAVVDQAVVDQVVVDQGNPQSDAIEPAVMDPDALDTASMDSQAPDATLAGLQTEVDTMLLMLDEDPDFYLWLGGDDALPASLEPSHDPT